MSFKRPGNLIDWKLLASTIHNGICQLQHEDSCTDFAVEIGEKSFRCHKVVLASVSDYFKALFGSGMKENEENKVVFNDISPESFQIILKILYPEGQANPLENIQETEISDLLKLAERFQMKFMTDICLKYYKRTMSVGNCVARWKLGDAIMCEELSNLGFEFITEHFEEMATDNILVSLELEDFRTIVMNENMHVKREDRVWLSIRNWIDFDREKRSMFISDLLKECCLTEIDPDLLVEEIAFDPVVRQNDTASQLVQEAVKYKRHPGMHGNIELKFRECHEKRQSTFLLLREVGDNSETPFSAGKALSGIAVCSGKAWKTSVDRLLTETVKLGRFTEKLSFCVHGESVYILTENKHLGSKLWEYNGSDNCWECLRDMDIPLVGHTMCAADGCLYVTGGRSTLHMNAQVWQYSIAGDSWTIFGEIMAPVVNASSVCVNSKIYIFGGELEKNSPADCVQIFDTDTQTGTIFCNLPKPFSWSRAIVRGKMAYVVTSDGDVVNVCLESGESNVLASIPRFERVDFGICLQRNELFVFGGQKNNSDEETEKGITAKENKREDFIVDINKGDVTSSRWLFNAGYRKCCEVMACVSVVLNIAELAPLDKESKV